MGTEMRPTHQWNGVPATADQLGFLALQSYGNYTFFQVRRQAVRGLSLHVDRLRANGTELFGTAPSEEQLRELLRAAVSTQAACSVRVTLVGPDLGALTAGDVVEPDVVVTVSEARESSTTPISVRTVNGERDTPWVKHRSTHGLVRHVRQARQAGFDDALLVNRSGLVSEGTFWNALLRCDETWIWPDADALPGVTMHLLQRAMDQVGLVHVTRPVKPADLSGCQAAFALNSTSPAKPIAQIDDHYLPGDPMVAAELEQLWQGIAAEPL